MRHPNPMAAFVVCALLVVGGLLSICAAQGPAATKATIAQNDVASAPSALATLYANVYLQTSAEYRACCHGIYACAARQLESALASADPAPERPAVVMDLDETVLDVSAFQTFLYENNLEYSPEMWADFERTGVDEVSLVPGAKAFIERAEELGATVVYLSNRNAANQEWTVAALERLGIDTSGISERIYLKPEGGSSDKSARREAVAARYDVLMYVGDNLRDFSDAFAAPELPAEPTAEDCLRGIGERSKGVDEAVGHWGVDWFVLPNPVYGEWEELIGPVPEAILRPPYRDATSESE